MQLSSAVNGVILTEVDSDSFLKRQNIKKDDIIIEMQNESISSTGDIIEVIEKIISQGKENVLMVFYAGPNSRKYIGARLSIE